MIHNGPYSISAVSSMTGVNSVTLRAWERRYGLIRPTRTEAGHRLYTQKDIEQIKLILQFMDEGIAIGRVKDALRIAAEREITPGQADESPWSQYTQDMLGAVVCFDEVYLERVYNEVMSLYSVEVVTQKLLLPLLEILAERWKQSDMGIAEEHFFSVFMRNKLGSRFHHRNTQNTGPLLVAACLPGEQHEFGLLLFALAAHAQNYRLILLGANMPLSPLRALVKQTRSKGIVLAGSVEIDPKILQNQLSTLCRETNVPVWVGGTCASHYRNHIEAAGAIAIGDDLLMGLRTLNKHYSNR